MENLKKLFETKLEEIQKLKTYMLEHKLLGDNDDEEKKKTIRDMPNEDEA